MAHHTSPAGSPAGPNAQEATMLYIHQTSGRGFTATGAGETPGTLAGTWDNGQAGVIYPGERFRDQTLCWVADPAGGRCVAHPAYDANYCPRCGTAATIA
jgi:hypothetical protein